MQESDLALLIQTERNFMELRLRKFQEANARVLITFMKKKRERKKKKTNRLN